MVKFTDMNYPLKRDNVQCLDCHQMLGVTQQEWEEYDMQQRTDIY